MFFIYLLSPLFIITYLYSKYLNYYKNSKFTKKLTFNDNTSNTFILLTIEQYSSDFKEIHSIIYNQKCKCNKKILINNLDSLNIKENNNHYNIVNYVYNNKTYKALITENSFEFPIVNEVKKYVYLNNIKSAELIYKDSTKNITEFLLDYIGPNYDFNYETEYKQNINTILKIEKLIDTNTDTDTDFNIKLIDNFDNEVYINEILVWKPNII